jgi:hypothetical protein
MIPVLSNTRQPIPNRFQKTLADTLLPEYDKDLAIVIADENGKDMVIPVWRFIEMFLRIKDRKGRYSTFAINEAQCEFYKAICLQRREKKPMRADVLKARQLGFSTFIAAIIFVRTILVPNQTACIIADTAEHATNLFKKYKFYYSNLPDFFKQRLPLVASNAKELTVDYGSGQTSTVRVLVQGENAGRSDTCQYLHLSEVAFWQNIEETTTSILQTVDDTNLDSLIVYETTANGVNYYKEVWDMDVSGETGYIPFFSPWYLDQNYRREYWGFELEEREKKMMADHNLDLEQIAWYRSQLMKMRGNLKKLGQEFPTAPTDAFITSGNSVFNMDLLMEQKEKIIKRENKGVLKRGSYIYRKEHSRDGNRIDLTEIRFSENETGRLKIYEEPIAGHHYIVCNDPAMGGEDDFATVVIDNYDCRQVAVFDSNMCDADEAAYQMYCLGVEYNNALITGETNTTSYLLKLVSKCGYRNIYQDQDAELINGRYQDKYGYKTKTTNRQLMIDMLAEAFRDNPEIIRDYKTLCQMERFQVVRNSITGKEKIEATGKSHDDLVMAMCGVFLCRHAQKSVPISVSEQKNKTNIFDPCHFNDEGTEIEEAYQIWY